VITRFRDPAFLSLVLIAGLALFYLTQMPIGELYRYDEFKTLDRSNGFLLFGDWTTVYASNIPNFQKPPLQYWMGAAFLSTGMNEHLAMKLPSWLFSVVCLFATVALVREIAPRLVWAAPAAIVLLASSTEFWSHAMSGMLETGSAAFVTLALLFAYRGLREPRNWWWCALVIGLGALQKSPAALLAVVVFTVAAALAGKAQGTPMPGLRSRSLLGAGLLALALVALWPFLQTVFHGYDAIRVGLKTEMMDRFVPGEATGNRGFGDVWRIVIRDEPLLRLGAIAGLFVLPGMLREPRLWGFTALTLGYVLSVYVAGGSVYPRYTLNFLPLFCAVVAIWIFHSGLSMRRKWIVIGIMSLLMLGPVKPAILVSAGGSGAGSPETAVLPPVGAQLRPDEVLVVCAWESEGRLSPGAVSFYASDGRPFFYLRSRADLEARLQALKGKPIRGLCPASDFPTIRALLDDAEPAEPLADGYVQFRGTP